MDGASGWQNFRLITVPMINPTIMLVLVLRPSAAFPSNPCHDGRWTRNSTLSGILYLYKQAFFFNKMGYATTIGFFWAMIIFVVVLLQRRLVETEAV
jgi:multiple sugar transport system permease protein